MSHPINNTQGRRRLPNRFGNAYKERKHLRKFFLLRQLPITEPSQLFCLTRSLLKNTKRKFTADSPTLETQMLGSRWQNRTTIYLKGQRPTSLPGTHHPREPKSKDTVDSKTSSATLTINKFMFLSFFVTESSNNLSQWNDNFSALQGAGVGAESWIGRRECRSFKNLKLDPVCGSP
jgi:hypothetical protein